MIWLLKLQGEMSRRKDLLTPLHCTSLPRPQRVSGQVMCYRTDCLRLSTQKVNSAYSWVHKYANHSLSKVFCKPLSRVPSCSPSLSLSHLTPSSTNLTLRKRLMILPFFIYTNYSLQNLSFVLLCLIRSEKFTIWLKKFQELGTRIGRAEWSSMSLHTLVGLFIWNMGKTKCLKNF